MRILLVVRRIFCLIITSWQQKSYLALGLTMSAFRGVRQIGVGLLRPLFPLC